MVTSVQVFLMCLINIYTWYINMSNVTAGFGRFSVLFRNFHIVLNAWNVTDSSKLNKLGVKNCREEKETFVIIYVYINLVF